MGSILCSIMDSIFGLNIGSQYCMQYCIQFWVQNWVHYLVQYWVQYGLHSDGRTTKGRTTYNRTTNHRTTSAMVCTTCNYMCGSLNLIGDGMTGHFGILVSRMPDISGRKSGHFQILSANLSLFGIKRL